jgi:restriction endonuclease S subunit
MITLQESKLPNETALKLSDVLEEFDERLGERPEPEILTLTEKMGFVSQRERFKKRLAVADTSNYKFIGLNDIAFNPYLLWANAIAQNTDWKTAIISPLYPTFRVRKGYNSRFVNYLLCSGYLRSRFGAISYGSVPRKRRATVADFLNLPIPSQPSLAEQERIVKLLDEADELQKLRAQANRRTSTLIPALFHKMFGDPIANPKHWPTSSFSDVGTLDRGRSKTRPRNEPSLFGGKYPFIQTGDVANSNGHIATYTQSYSEKGLAQSRIWPAGTLVITIAANIGKTAILTFPACFPDSIVGFIPGESVLVEYVRQWLVTMESRLEESAPQMAQKNINLKILSDLKILVPPLSLQAEFAKRVGEIREMEAEQATSRKRLDDLFRSMLHGAFNGELLASSRYVPGRC